MNGSRFSEGCFGLSEDLLLFLWPNKFERIPLGLWAISGLIFGGGGLGGASLRAFPATDDDDEENPVLFRRPEFGGKGAGLVGIVISNEIL